MRQKRLLTVITIFLICSAIFLYLNHRPVKIIAVHQDKAYSSIIVDHMPLTAKGKIEWWMDHKDRLFKEYNVPKVDSDGLFRVYFWAFGEGYKELGKHDRLCFDDVPEPKNCIDKDNLMIVAKTREGNMRYTFDDAVYIQTPDGALKKRK